MTPLGVFCSDLHLRASRPSARADADWYAVMERTLRPLKLACEEWGVPLFIAGDILHRWDGVTVPPQLLNAAASWFPEEVYTIPGQHDLPNHSMDLRDRSAYQTLVHMGVIRDISEKPVSLTINEHTIHVYGYPWGAPIRPLTKPKPDGVSLRVALVHAYLHTGDVVDASAYVGACESSALRNILPQLEGYDFAAFGDNHTAWSDLSQSCKVVNCGAMIRTARDTKRSQPHYYSLWSDGSVKTHNINCDEDVWSNDAVVKTVRQDNDAMVTLASALAMASGVSVDYQDRVRQAMRGASPATQLVLEEILR